MVCPFSLSFSHQQPTSTPSQSPSANPSQVPTSSPSSNPSKQPTNVPSVSPSKGPSVSPSRAPTNGPTSSPSQAPCLENEFVQNNICVSCPAGTTNAAGDDPSIGDTLCDPTFCAVNEFVSANTCVACPADTTNAAGDDASGSDTSCVSLCSINEYVLCDDVNGCACVACPNNEYNLPGDDPSAGITTSCTTDSCTLTNVGPFYSIDLEGGIVGDQCGKDDFKFPYCCAGGGGLGTFACRNNASCSPGPISNYACIASGWDGGEPNQNGFSLDDPCDPKTQSCGSGCDLDTQECCKDSQPAADICVPIVPNTDSCCLIEGNQRGCDCRRSDCNCPTSVEDCPFA